MKQELEEQGYRRYYGETIDVYFNKDVCIHAAKCVQNLNEVFDTEKRPWIQPDQAKASDVEATVKLCPSGALQYKRDE
ncbi:(4Fe-4S)-binding protein [Alkalihalobacillus sp. LMS6]|uniref:(4Fe-4S)-binding protein n=1 Tax=Alkalihalobacillus sp. LMS6 TaxID=2924034 RepID=UPI0020D006AE|nr:(4Fe-4S)-binding protein [Alkalihalobacillus sp. LMS6]UTR06016.1 (4Fe-4S)-binding protein [Alkalihalobacillus sp. LMS6]